jgi:hypothetical protein
MAQRLHLLNEPLRARVDALNAEQQRAIDKLEQETQRQFASLRDLLMAHTTHGDEAILQRIASLKEYVEQYQRLRHDQDVSAEQEREKAASALREALTHQIQTGDENLRQHVDHQKEQVGAAFAASKEAIDKAEHANDKRFEALNSAGLVPREIFEATAHELRERGSTNVELIQGLSLRMTEMEARGGGEKDHAAELRATLALGAALISVVASVSLGLIALFAG